MRNSAAPLSQQRSISLEGAVVIAQKLGVMLYDLPVFFDEVMGDLVVDRELRARRPPNGF
jgi:hypothetical protein